MSSTHVDSFADPDNTLAADPDTVGGKGLSLASMTAAGFPVPAGFTVTTAAYRQFVSDNGLQEAIIDGAKPELVGTAVSFDSASAQIQALFAKSELGAALQAQIAEAYAALGDGDAPVAVRSSANAEDLPDLSFAGQGFHYAVNGYAYWTGGTPPGVESRTTIHWPGSANEQTPITSMRMFKKPPKYVLNHIYSTSKWARVYAERFASWRKETLPAFLAVIDEWRQVDPRVASDVALLDGMCALARADGETWWSPAMRLESMVSRVGTGMVMNMLRGAEMRFHEFLQKAAPGKGFSSGHFLSGLRSLTMEAQDEISDIAELIRADEGLFELVLTTPAQRLLPTLRERSEAALIVQAIDQHLARYGHQITTLDFAEPTLAEDLSPVMLNLKAVVQDSNHDPAATQIDIARRRQTALQEAKQAFSDEDWRELCDFLWVMKRVYPDREQALFYLGAGWPTLRRLALELGRRLVEAGTLTQPDDLFYLWRAQLEEAMAARQAGQALPELKERVAEQRELQQARLRLVPPDVVPPEEGWGPGWGKTANDADSDSLNGNACSPGQITARASLVMSPADFANMQPGTILVCPMTTPAWTQLFSQAKGLVTDIGSILTHGSIVAREYDIPAVLGVGIATQRIRHGQLIRVDGDNGVVALLDE